MRIDKKPLRTFGSGINYNLSPGSLDYIDGLRKCIRKGSDFGPVVVCRENNLVIKNYSVYQALLREYGPEHVVDFGYAACSKCGQPCREKQKEPEPCSI